MSTPLRSNPGPSAAHRDNVLCVDIEESSRLLIANTMDGHYVDFALTAEDAVELARGRVYVLCLVDPSVPRLYEVGLLQQLRIANQAIGIVFCTPLPHLTWVPSTGGKIWHLHKPMSSQSIQSLLARVWGSSWRADLHLA